MTPAPTAVVRTWARDNGYVVSDRGRIPAEVQRAYDAAHPGDAESPPAASAAPPAAGPQDWPQPTGQPHWGPPPSQPQWGPPPGQQPWPPPPGQQPWPPPPPVWHDTGTDGFAITALVLGILPVCGGLLGILFGILSLNRISGTHKSGRRLAIAGIVLGTLWLIGIGVGVAVSIANEADRDPSGAVTSSGDVDATQLRIGDCPEKAPEGTTYTVHVVPCSQPHAAEVFAQFTLEGPDFPGAAQVDRFASGGCRKRVAGYAGPDAGADYDLLYLVPTSDTWSQGDRQVTCMIGGPNGTSVRGSLRSA
jgi:hypothetical protein